MTGREVQGWAQDALINVACSVWASEPGRQSDRASLSHVGNPGFDSRAGQLSLRKWPALGCRCLEPECQAGVKLKPGYETNITRRGLGVARGRGRSECKEPRGQ